MFQATRRRLALWYTLVTAVLLLLFASGVYFYVRHTLVERIDDTLKHVVEVIDRSLVIQPLNRGHYRLNVEASFRSNAEAVEDDHIDLEWFNPQGQLLWSTLGDSSPITLPPGPKLEKIGFSDDRLLRQITERIERNQQVLGYLRVSHPWFEVTKPIQQLLFDLSLGLSLLVGSVGAIGWLLSGLAMEPIKESYQSLKQFTADASHELRNPIAVIQTNVQMALAYPDGDTQQQLKVIERLTQRLGNLVNDLLFLARSDSGTLQSQMQLVPLDALLLEVMEEQRLAAAGQGVQLSLDIPSSSFQETEVEFTVTGDWDQLARLFTNLISNALEHGLESSTPEGWIRLTLTRLQRERQPALQVVVADNGRGIAPEQLAHLFDRFYRADPARSSLANKGMGLGLAIAQAIAHHHQGQISVKSEVGQGTQFTVLLPCARSLD
jgi:OmpR-family two-component system manganese-sensing sensor histidine kinase